MKKIEGDKVFINKGMLLHMREQVDFLDQPLIVPTDLWLPLNGLNVNKFDMEFLFYLGKEENFVFIEITDERAKEFVRNADFILDYDEYFNKPLDELMEIHDVIAKDLMKKADEINAKIDACKNKDEADKLYDSTKPMMDALDLQELELYDLVFYKKKIEEEAAEKEAEERRKDAERIASEEQQIEEIFYGPEEEKTTLVTKVLGKFLGRGRKTKK